VQDPGVDRHFGYEADACRLLRVQPQLGLDAQRLIGRLAGPGRATHQQKRRREFHIFSSQILYHRNAAKSESSQLELRQSAPKWLTAAKEFFSPRGGVVF
jgi:hypothetical protein